MRDRQMLDRKRHGGLFATVFTGVALLGVGCGDGLFFAVRSTVVLSLYDAFKPLADARLASPQST